MFEFAISVARLFEFAGIAVIILGTVLAIVGFGRGLFIGGSPFTDDGRDLFPAFLKTLCRSILTGRDRADPDVPVFQPRIRDRRQVAMAKETRDRRRRVKKRGRADERSGPFFYQRTTGG
jgi:hypothetical protein